MLRSASLFVFALTACTTPAKPPVETVALQRAPSFPAVMDWSSVKISYSSIGAPWVAPAYVIEITGDGTVTYRGGQNVKVVGERTARIDPDVVRALVDKFREADFLVLENRYRARVTDQDTRVIALSFDSISKRVEDYAGGLAGMPQAVGALQIAIHQAVDAAQWTGFELH